MKTYSKRIFVYLLSILIISSGFFSTEVYGQGSWSGNSWEGDSWEGQSWEGESFEGESFEGESFEGESFEGESFEGESFEGESFEGESFEGESFEGESFEGESFEGESFEGESFEGENFDGDSWEGEAWEGDSWEGEAWEGDGIETTEDDKEVLCLPSEGSCTDVYGNPSDLPRDKKIDYLVDQYVKEHPFSFAPDFFPFKKIRQNQIDKIREEVTSLVDRPHGTVQDANIPVNELATLAEAGYRDKDRNDELSKVGWVDEEIEFENENGGFHARTYSNDENKVVISFSGTDDLRDYLTDWNLARGKGDSQFRDALNYVDQIIAENPNAEIVVTGHSLGGALAQYVAIHRNIPATTFNAPGIATQNYGLFEDALSWAILDNENVDQKMKYYNQNGAFNDLIVNHVMEKDEIGTYQIHLGTTNTYSADGTVVCTDDYSDEKREKDRVWPKVKKTVPDLINKVPNHGMEHFWDLMVEC